MPIQVTCGCGKVLNVGDELAGKAVKCPACGKPVQVRPARPAKAQPAVSKPVAPARVCKNHPGARAVGNCLICAQPICSECRQSLGYYCCPEHQAQGAAGKEERRQQAQEFQRDAAKFSRKTWLTILGVVAATVIIIVVMTILDTKGEVKWSRSPTQSDFMRAPVFVAAGDKVYICEPEKGITVVDAGSGKDVCKIEVSGLASQGAYRVEADDKHLVLFDGSTFAAVSLADSRVTWTHKVDEGDAAERLPFGEFNMFARSGPPFQLAGDRLYYVTAEPIKDQSGGQDENENRIEGVSYVLHSIGMADGRRLWKRTVGEKGNVSSIAASEGAVCVAMAIRQNVQVARPQDMPPPKYSISVVDSASGAGGWKSDDLELVCEPLLSAGLVFLRTTESLNCLDAKTGGTKWKTSSPSGRPGFCLMSGDRVLYEDKQKLTCAESAAGKQVWQSDVTGPFYSFRFEKDSCFAILGEKMDLGAAGGSLSRINEVFDDMGPASPGCMAPEKSVLVCIDLENGALKWKAEVQLDDFAAGEGFLVCAGTQSVIDLTGKTKGIFSIAQSQAVLKGLDPESGEVEWAYYELYAGIEWWRVVGNVAVVVLSKTEPGSEMDGGTREVKAVHID
ncbi:MAG: PQQ-binding-like beta-propeller repeat protein [Planctomycetota bacterium]|nr:PQQ-binding-like beta-propeller repeat protein [Planctomycetota bacterium]